MIAAADDVAAGVAGYAGVVTTSTDVAGVAVAIAVVVVADVVSTAATTDAATTALSFSAVAAAFTVPIAMHLSRYGRLPSWNKSRTQCLVIFHSSTTKDIPSYCDNIPCDSFFSRGLLS